MAPGGAASGEHGGRQNGTAFGGRLEYNYMPRQVSAQDQGGREQPKKSVIDYQFLRLKFLLNKVKGEIARQMLTGREMPLQLWLMENKHD